MKEPDYTQDDPQADQLRTEVLAILSHELRTPLAAIKGYVTAMLLEEVAWPEEKRREFLQLISEEADNLQTMIAEILDTTRLETGLLQIERQPMRLHHAAREVADEMQQRTTSHHFVLDFPHTLPLIDADPRRIKQVFRNILDNAVKYSPDGGPIIISGRSTADFVQISIRDQGIGMTPEQHSHLFEKFYRAHSSANGPRGTGLGLAICRLIVEGHGGEIWAQSEEGEGSTFIFTVPALAA